MITDSEIRDDVTEELRWDPRLTGPDSIGVAVTDGAVTLTGHVASYTERMAAARATERVYGVRAVANDVQVKLAGIPRDDSDIATAIAHVLDWNTQIPKDAVHAQVNNGFVMLDGEVEHDYQRRAVERMAGEVRGVVGVTNTITVAPTATPLQVQGAIEDAFRRQAQVDAHHVKVEVSGDVATLSGNVHSMHEAIAATAAAAAAPGISMVKNHLVVTP